MMRTLFRTYLPGVLGEAPLVGLEDLLAPGELELSTPESLDGGGAVVVLRADGDDDLAVQTGVCKKGDNVYKRMKTKPLVAANDRRFEYGSSAQRTAWACQRFAGQIRLSWTLSRGWPISRTALIYGALGLGYRSTHTFLDSVHRAWLSSSRKFWQFNTNKRYAS